MQGTITDQVGAPISGAFVAATPTGPSGRLTLTTISSAKGVFTFTQATPGVYAICVQVPNTAYLNPCHWSASPKVTVMSGQVAQANPLRLTTGSLLQVRINDPSKLFPAGSMPSGDDVLVGVSSPVLLFHELHRVASDKSGKTFEMRIPYDAPLRLTVKSAHLQIVDGSGILAGAATTVQHSSSRTNPALVFTVTGRK